jgi:hypothetical protein
MLSMAGGTLTAAMGVARGEVEVYDADRNQLRVELFGRGRVMQAVASEDGRSIDAMELDLNGETRFDRVR